MEYASAKYAITYGANKQVKNVIVCIHLPPFFVQYDIIL